MPKPYVYIWWPWTDHESGTALFTVTDDVAIVILACLALLITLSGSQCWGICRHFLAQRFGPGEIQIGEEKTSLSRVSQFEAIAEGSKAGWRRLRRARERDDEQLGRIPPIFGAVAIMIFAAFTTMSVVIPYHLSQESNETPFVKSRWTETCQTSRFDQRLLELDHYDYNLGTKYSESTVLAHGYYKQCWFRQLGQPQGLRQDLGCNKIFESRPVLWLKDADCPFANGTCSIPSPAAPARMFYRSMLSLGELGFNSAVRINMEQNVTCAPLDLSNFARQLVKPWSQFPYILHFGSSPNEVDLPYAVGMLTTNRNGSGRVTALREARIDLDMKPGSFTKHAPLSNRLDEFRHLSGDEWLSERLRRVDARVFIIVYRPGGTLHNSPHDDPVFGAHDPFTNRDGLHYLADFEASAIGCTEQFRFCPIDDVDETSCTPWDKTVKHLPEILATSGKPGYLKEDEIMFRIAVAGSSVFHFLSTGSGAARADGMISRSGLGFYEEDEWMHQVCAWLDTALLAARFEILDLVQNGIAPLPSLDDQHQSRSEQEQETLASICNNVLFLDGDYTNIVYGSFWACFGAFASFSLLCLIVPPAWKLAEPYLRLIPWRILGKLIVMLRNTLSLCLSDKIPSFRNIGALFRPVVNVVRGASLPAIDLGSGRELDAGGELD